MQGLEDAGLLSEATWEHMLLALAVVLTGYLLGNAARRALRRLAERAAPARRLAILRAVPVARLAIVVLAFACAIPIVMTPSSRNVASVLVGVGLVLAFALKDYASSLVAGLVTVAESTYQPGDWIEVDGAYGEVRRIDLRATHLVTADDTEIIIPHSRLWSKSIANASSGQHRLLCVTSFYLHPDHDAAAVQRSLSEVAELSAYKAPDTAVTVSVADQPWGTHYRIKTYVADSRNQFQLTTDITVRGKTALRAMGTRFAEVPQAIAA